MRQLRLKKKSIFGAQIVLKVFPGVFSSQKQPKALGSFLNIELSKVF